MKTTRAQRRAYLKWLKKNNPKEYAKAKKEVKKIGKDLHRRHVAEQLRKAQDGENTIDNELSLDSVGTAPINFEGNELQDGLDLDTETENDK